ncbi:MAG: TrmH family RNA methyltransferase [Patescibacteria group bacterium]
MKHLILIAHNLRSAHNVGSLLRTAEGLGVDKVYLTGYTPYPLHSKDERLPHLATKIDKQISKTALGAETSQSWQHINEIDGLIKELKQDDYLVTALEQTPNSIKLTDFKSRGKVALIVGREVEGVEPEVLAACDNIVEIPMFGSKESFNVAQAAAMSLYHLRFMA